jgi:rubrerythrin
MKKLLGFGFLTVALVLAVVSTWADEATPSAGTTAAVSQPTAVSTPAAKGKKTKKPKKTAKEVWVCPMGDYKGPKTADGKCPNCGMDLVKQK